MPRGPDHPSLVREIRRIAQIDFLLRSDGLNIPRLAAEWGISARTVQRYLVTIRGLIGETESIEYAATEDSPRHFLQRYVARVPEFFVHDF